MPFEMLRLRKRQWTKKVLVPPKYGIILNAIKKRIKELMTKIQQKKRLRAIKNPIL